MLLRATIAGVRGVVSTVSHRTGDVVLCLSGRITHIPNDQTISIDRHTHVMDPRVGGVRADSSPNVAVRNGKLLASRPICPGDEITIPLSRRRLQ